MNMVIKRRPVSAPNLGHHQATTVQEIKYIYIYIYLFVCVCVNEFIVYVNYERLVQKCITTEEMVWICG